MAHNCHSKSKSLTAREKHSRQKQIHSRQKQFYPAEYTCLVWFAYFDFAKEFLVSAVVNIQYNIDRRSL